MFSYKQNQSLGFLAGMASRLLNNTLAVRFQTAGIDMTAEQWGAIIILLNSESMTQRKLGERLFLEKSSVSRLINGLEKRGWIERSADRQDARKKLVIPTPKVVDTAEHCATIARAILNEAQMNMTEDEMLLLRSLLSRVITNLGASIDGQEPSTPLPYGEI